MDKPLRMLDDAATRQSYGRDCGGALYPIQCDRTDKDDWRRHYGDVWPVLASPKHRYHPANVLASGPDVFG
jgi:hypothetical protein